MTTRTPLMDRSGRPSDRVPVPIPRRWRLAVPGSRLRPCPLRSEADDDGVRQPLACADLSGTLEECRGCRR